MHRPKWPLLLAHGPGVVVVNCWDRFCTLGKAPRTKETLPDFREWCRVTRHPRVFRGLTGCQRTLGDQGITAWYQNLEIRIPKAWGTWALAIVIKV